MCSIQSTPPPATTRAARPAAAPASGPRDQVSLGDIPLDQPWKRPVYEFTRANLQHTAWGLAHSERDYLLSLDIAQHAGLKVDPDVLFAAAFLHDMGGFPPYAQPNVDHAVRSAEICDQVLIPAGFPADKVDAVRSAIRTHSYYDHTPPQTPEAVALHDADTLDFLGAMGVARIVSLTQREAFAPDLEGSLKMVERLMKDAPGAVVSGPYAQGLAQQRVEEMKGFLTAVGGESFSRQHV